MRRLLQDRKTLYFTLGIILISVLLLTIVYAALSVTLNITGRTEITASSWDIHLANPEVKSGSVSSTVPTISGNNLSFSANLTIPGDYYEFTVDVVNDGNIDAMIDSVVKTPELTSEQAKYIKYEVSYENGESITTSQTIKSGTSTPIKVRVEYRTDISSSDLPSSTTVLNLKLSLIYVQSDGTGSKIPYNGAEKVVNVVSGDGTQIGDELCIKEECFYVISSTDTSVTMLSKMNISLSDNPVQISPAPTIAFSSTNYWLSTVSSYPAYVYNSSSNLYTHVENYKTYLGTLGVTPIETRLITYEEVYGLVCNGSDCGSSPSWVYATSYWTGSVTKTDYVFSISKNVSLVSNYFDALYTYGVRPVITISRDYL